MIDFKRVIKLLRIERKDFYLTILCGSSAGLASVALFADSGYLISKAVLLPPLFLLVICIALLKLFAAIRAFSRYSERYFSHRATFTALSHIRTYFFEKLEPLAAELNQRYRSGDLLARIVGDVESLQHVFLRIYYPPIVMLIVFLATIAFTAIYSLYIALLFLIALLLTGLVIPIISIKLQERQRSRLRATRGELSARVTEFLYGFLDLKLYGQLKCNRERLLNASSSYIQQQLARGLIELRSSAIQQGVALLTTWSVIALGAYLVTTQSLNGVYLAMLVFVALNVFETAAPIAEAPCYVMETRQSSARLQQIIETEIQHDQLTSQQPPPGGSHWRLKHAPSITFKAIYSRYPNQSRDALSNIDLTLAAGTKTAIVGPSGSGKSTLLRMLLKQGLPDRGEILVNEQPLKQLSEEAWLSGISAVLQQNHFFYGTVRENLCLAGNTFSDKRLQKALVDVMLPHISLDTPIQERGANLSGGEKQRIAIARAMLKGGTLWLLDEPTSWIDPVTERYIYKQILQKTAEHTMVLVSHRLAGLEAMDQIIVMDKGKIIETGTYHELMKREGYFYKLRHIEKSIIQS